MTDGVHAAHCCVVHGCKYLADSEDCPVVRHRVRQEALCERCDDDRRDPSRPWQWIPHLDPEPGWWVFSDTQIAPYSRLATSSAIISAPALKWIMGSYVYRKGLLVEVNDSGAALIDHYFPVQL